MKIAVLIKQVKDPQGITLGADFTVDRSRGGNELSPADKSALLLAAALGARDASEIAAVTMGPASADEILREAAVSGAGRLLRLTDTLFAGSDTLVTSRVLARALEQLVKPELVLCGRHAIDGETGQVGPETAVRLGFSCVTNILSAAWHDERTLAVRRLLEDRTQTLLVPLPAVLCVCEGVVSGRLPSISQLRQASKTPVEILSNRDLQVPPELCGLAGSPTRVVGVRHDAPGFRKARILTDAWEGAAMIAEKLREARP